MCFLKQGLLFREFDETFCAVFGTRAEKRKAVLEVLAHGSMMATEIAERLGGDVNGHLTRTLKELEYADPMTTFLSNRSIYESVICGIVPQVRELMWIAVFDCSRIGLTLALQFD